VQIDDPHSKRVFKEGEDVSIDFSPDRVRILAEDEA
jgi:iron(III) transport system ATP-binding protein